MAWNPLLTASRAAGWLINPRGSPRDSALREAVRGKIVLVTGASRGIGEATARRLAEAGATVLLVARSEERLRDIEAEIAEQGGSVRAYVADLGDPDSVDALVATVLERHDYVDVVVSNAGKSIRRSIELSYDRFHDFERTIDINYLGPVKLLLGLLPSMRERGEGHIVNVSTIGVRMPPGPRWAAYQASKAAFDVFLRSAATETRTDGVTATSVYMALVHTEMSAPTPIFRYVPGQTPDEAADVICQAIVDRPRTIAPWWAELAEATFAVSPRATWEVTSGLAYRLSGDTSSAIEGTADALAGAGGGKETSVTDAGPVFDVGLWARALKAVADAGVLTPVRPDRFVRMAGALRLGPGIAAGCALLAARHPDHVAIADDRGTLTYAELNVRGAAVATGLRDEFGVGSDRPLAVMCRNHRGFLEAMLAGSRLGADLLLLNTDFPAPQLAEVLEIEKPGAAVHDEEFTPAFDEAGFDGPRALGWCERDDDGGDVSLDALVTGHAGRAPASLSQGRIVLLTSGTTGTPKGAPRDPSLNALIGPMTTLLSRVPLRAREPMLIAPPFFHGFGLAYLGLALFLGSTIVAQRRFDADAALDAVERHRVTAMVAVPVMYQRMLAAGGHERGKSLRVAISAAAPLSPALADAFMDTFGDVLYNLYGSTETGFGAIATPKDLREAPGTVGRAPYGTTLRILDDDRQEVSPGATGTVFLGGPLIFEGYTTGGSQETVDGLMSTGDRGHLDDEGRLFIDGRDDDMIVSGGENVFPKEVEDVLTGRDDVEDAAVVGVDDEDFGQRLRAFVVARAGADLSEDTLKAHVKERLARYKVPREFVVLDEIPRNATGKVLKKELPEPSAPVEDVEQHSS